MSDLFRCPICGTWHQDLRRGLGVCESAPAAVITHRAMPHSWTPALPPPEPPEPHTIAFRECRDCERAREWRMWWSL